MNRTAIEMTFLILYRQINYLSRIDNNDCPDIILDQIRTKINDFNENCLLTFGKTVEQLFK